MPSLEVLGVLGGAVAGFLGALVGVGGGVLLVPILNSLMGLSFSEARAVSLVGVLGTSSSAAMARPRRPLVNFRLATFLLFFSVSGALLGAKYLHVFSDRTCEVIFGITAAVVAVLALMRRNTRNILPADTPDIGTFGSRIHDDETDQDVAYRVKRLPLAASIGFLSGALASLIGIGGGIVIVPALNSLCGVPMRVAAATSVLMIGVTAIPASVGSWSGGFLGDYHLAGMTSLGALVGFQIGLRLGPNTSVKWLKTGMSLLLSAVSIQYLFFRS